MSTMQTDSASPVEQAQEMVQEGASQARGALTQQIDNRSTQIGQQLRDVAEAFRRTGRGLDTEGSETPARLVHAVSDRAERLGSYLEQSSSDRLLQDAEHYGRRNPWMVIAGGLALGLAASRLLKASSNRRFEQLQERGYTSQIRNPQWEGQ